MERCKALHIIILCLLSLGAYGQPSLDNLKKDEPYNGFKFKPFVRGFDQDSVKDEIDAFMARQSFDRTVIDSLDLALMYMMTDEVPTALQIYRKVRPEAFRTKDKQIFLLATLKDAVNYENQDEADEAFELLRPEVKEEGVRVWKSLKGAYFSDNFDKWNKTNDVIPAPLFNHLDSKGKPTSQYLEWLEAHSDLLHQLVRYTDNNDPVLSEYLFEFGKYLERDISLTQAYVAYSISYNYDIFNSDVSKQRAKLKSKIRAKKYFKPNVSEYFIRNRPPVFTYEFFKRKQEKRKAALENKEDLSLYENKTDKSFDYKGVIPLTAILVLILIALFIGIGFGLKTKKK